jgi:NADPH:quinone reductase-like Zn-dependent oxidoreductase
LLALGATRVFIVERHGASFEHHVDIRDTVSRLGGFDGVIDPFFDLHLRRVLPVMAFGGRYVTCGFAAQFDPAGSGPQNTPDYAEALQIAMLKNIGILGHCAGLRSDLERAAQDYAAGHLPPMIDTVFGPDAPAAFLDRTYNARDRFGKVVCCYD